MRKWVKTFKQEFAQMVINGSKLTTIRPWPKDGKIPVAGDMLDARMWSGKAYRSSQLKLGTYRIISADAFEIRRSNLVITHDIILPEETLAYIAKCDGFKSWGCMFTWFIQNYKLPFLGVRIKWSTIKGIGPGGFIIHDDPERTDHKGKIEHRAVGPHIKQTCLGPFPRGIPVAEINGKIIEVHP